MYKLTISNDIGPLTELLTHPPVTEGADLSDSGDDDEEADARPSATAADNETPAQIAKRTGVDLRRLLDENRDIKGLRRNAKLIEGTVLYLPTDA